MTPDGMWGFALTAGAGALGWARSVEARIIRHDAIIDKLDELITLLLEEKIDKGKGGGDAPLSSVGSGGSK